MAEWGAALRAVDLARGQFTVIELGCGWGCWMNNAGVAARRVGLDVHLIGIEGDEGHAAFAQEACAANGFTPKQVSVHRGIAAATSGIALFPRQGTVGPPLGIGANIRRDGGSATLRQGIRLLRRIADDRSR